MTGKNSVKNERQQSPAPISSGKRRLFTLLAWITPIGFLLLLEIILRLIGVAGRPPLFVSAPAPYNRLLIANPKIAQRFFRGDRFIPTPAADPFLKEKPANGLRIFVLGGSTAAGFPYERNLRFSRILETALQRQYPDRTVEVVNLAMSAINSYALLDFMDEVLAQKPDAILLYAGHNEYYGALGVASRESLGRRREWVLAALKLQRLRLFMAMRNLTARLRPLPPSSPTATLMERVVAEQQIPLDEALYRAGIDQFEKNLRAILQKAKVPVILGELVCNLKDQPPFISLPDESAEAVYRQAQQAAAQHDYQSAKTLYLRAKELDALRFRAPEAVNDVIRRLAAEFRQPLAPMVSRFEDASPNGLIGDRLMIDHLHPNIDGYFLMAQVFADAMTALPMLNSDRRIVIDCRDHGYTALDSLYGEFGIRVLKAGWPFKEKSAGHALDSIVPQNFPEELALKAIKYDNYTLRTAHETLAEHYEQSGDLEAALREYRALTAFKPLSPAPYLKAAELLNRIKSFNETIAVLLPVLPLDDAGHAHILLGQAYLGLNDPDQALAHFQQAQKKLGADAVIAEGIAQAQRQKAGQAGGGALLSGVVPLSPEVAALMQRAQQHLRDKSYDQAFDLLQAAVAKQEVPLAHLWLGQIQLDRGQLQSAIAHLQKARAGLPNHPFLLYNLSMAYFETGAHREAQETLAALQRLRPDFGDPYGLAQKIAAALNQ